MMPVYYIEKFPLSELVYRARGDVPISDMTPFSYESLKKSLKEKGQINPVTVVRHDTNDVRIGHNRCAALEEMGKTHIKITMFAMDGTKFDGETLFTGHGLDAAMKKIHPTDVSWKFSGPEIDELRQMGRRQRR